MNSLFDGMTCDCPAYRIVDRGDPIPVASAGGDSNRMYLFMEGLERELDIAVVIMRMRMRMRMRMIWTITNRQSPKIFPEYF